MLFDLDGTLADTAPDLAAAANRMLVDRGLPPVAFERLRPVASHGARGLLAVAFDRTPDDPDYEGLRVEFLATYESALAVHSKLFDGMPAVLDGLERAGWSWGIVTNKATRLTVPVTAWLDLATRAGTIVSGDTTPFSKPHPAPLLHAAGVLGLPPDACLYVGDDPRDIAAGRAAGMRTVAVGWGYGPDPSTWGADLVVARPHDLLALL